jgi:hypothetical protein
MAFSHVEGLDVATVTPAAWTPPGLPDGITIQVMGEDPDTGAVTAVLHLPAGWSSSTPIACAAEQELFVLGGVLVQGQATMRGGGYSAHPAGEGQGEWRSPEGCRMIARYTSTPEFATARASAGAAHPLTVEAVDSWALPWIDPLAASAPSEEFRTGVMVKLLRRNDETGASTHMAGLMPGWFMTGQEVHPVIEENYCLSGDVHVADVAGKPGYTMTPGVYLARPAGVAHGPIVSKNGNVNLVFAHGFLGIDYVVHPDADALIAAHLDQFPWV